MELWIRCQDRHILDKVEGLYIEHIADNQWCISNNLNMVRYGTYKTKKRALEVLDEIQKKINQTFICKLNHLVNKTDYERLKLDLEVKYPNNKFIIQPVDYELEPINTNVVIYKMPKE